ncbi:MAG: HAD-IA family hydrolase [Armatimonadetes bacterium]|nr:HAD-IA family hydrolase [Armatimonadota bacterium]
MPIRCVSFDCAGTLLRSNWEPGQFAADLARAEGFEPTDLDVKRYRLLFHERIPVYWGLHRLGSEDSLRGFWLEITEAWLGPMGGTEAQAKQLADRGHATLPNLFETYPDVEPALAMLEEAGIRRFILSNWDYSLQRVLEAHSLADRFEFALASLFFGAEKPDPTFFRAAATRVPDLAPDDILHVGDDPIDDLQGATDFGWHAVLIDRDDKHPDLQPRMFSLEQLREWI